MGRVPQRVLEGQDGAPGVPEQHRGVQPVELPHLVEVIEVQCERDVLRPHPVRGVPAAPLVVVDQPESVGQSIQLGQEIAVVEVGPTVQDDDGLTPADRSRVERGAGDRDAPFDCARASLSL